MNLIPLELTGLLLIEPQVRGDARGFFFELYQQPRYAGAGVAPAFAQDNVSFSRRGILRGLHFQNPMPQGKLVTVLQGEVFDVAVDLRRGSPTFKRWVGLTLSGDSKRQLYVPAGFAHGFVVTSETALFHYKCTELYSPKDEITVRWNDPDLGIQWPLTDPILSDRDAHAPCLRDLSPNVLFP